MIILLVKEEISPNGPCENRQGRCMPNGLCWWIIL